MRKLLAFFGLERIKLGAPPLSRSNIVIHTFERGKLYLIEYDANRVDAQLVNAFMDEVAKHGITSLVIPSWMPRPAPNMEKPA